MRELEELRRRNAELEREVRERKEKEEATLRELQRTRERLRYVEEAEERLCRQLAELEAEAVEHAREHRLRVKALADQLDVARAIISSAGLRHDLVIS